MIGLVLRSTGSWYSVELEGVGVVPCRVRGKIRLAGVRSTNPVAVGDRVRVELNDSGDEGVIVGIEARENYIIRRATNLSKESHILASNLDLALLFLPSYAPVTPFEFADRFLATAYAYRVPAVVVLPKSDLKGEQDGRYDRDVEEVYCFAGYPVVSLSSVSGEGVEELRGMLRGRKTLVVGQSGSGKSAFLNALDPGLELPVGELTEGQLGRHTTTFAEMFPLESEGSGTYVIDSPGIKGFGVIDFERGEISHFFPEIFALSSGCRFNNCLHDQEPECAVASAVERGELPASRYASYLSLLDDADGFRRYR